jgi:hypothetical protein
MAPPSVLEAVQHVVAKVWLFAGMLVVAIAVALAITLYIGRNQPRPAKRALFSFLAFVGAGYGRYFLFGRAGR